jgi:hypothetical protein
MAEVGLLAPDARVELIEGEIIDMAPIGMEHGWVVDRLNHLLVTTLVGDVYTETRTDDAPGNTAITAMPGLFVDLSPILLSA